MTVWQDKQGYDAFISTFGIKTVIGQDEISSGVSGAAVLPRAVRRAIDFMQAGFERDIGIADLAAAAGLSARALQRQFKTFLARARMKRCVTSGSTARGVSCCWASPVRA